MVCFSCLNEIRKIRESIEAKGRVWVNYSNTIGSCYRQEWRSW